MRIALHLQSWGRDTKEKFPLNALLVDCKRQHEDYSGARATRLVLLREYCTPIQWCAQFKFKSIANFSSKRTKVVGNASQIVAKVAFTNTETIIDLFCTSSGLRKKTYNSYSRNGKTLNEAKMPRTIELNCFNLWENIISFMFKIRVSFFQHYFSSLFKALNSALSYLNTVNSQPKYNREMFILYVSVSIPYNWI